MTLDLLVLGTAALLSFGLIRIGRSSFYRLAISSTGVLNVMLGNQDEDEKIEELQNETLNLLLRLFTFLGLLLASGLLFVLVCHIAILSLALHQEALFNNISSWQGIIALSIGATLPFIIPFKKSKSGYTELGMLLHRMVLNNYHIGLKLFRREVKNRQIPLRSDFLIVSGLARAGTTSLMDQIAQIEGFRSLNYANMPFLLSPNTWARFHKPKNGQTKERSHKDGIQIGLQSNEALEEYFWKALSNDSYIGSYFLEEYGLKAEEAEDYLRYQSLIRQSESDIYLAKNNNFLLRYESLRLLNPKFKMVILFREPLLHAASLLEKHKQYQKLQEEDPFVKEYMDWLGHHEFGLGQKPFVFEEQDPPEGDKNQLDYWLKIWINYYQKANSLSDDNIHFVAYERFCADPLETLQKIVRAFDLSAERLNEKPFVNQRPKPERPNLDSLNKAEELYQKLLLRT